MRFKELVSTTAIILSLIHFMFPRVVLSFANRAPKRLPLGVISRTRTISAEAVGDSGHQDLSVKRVSHISLKSNPSQLFGDYERIMSQGKSRRKLSNVTSLELSDNVWVRGRVQTIRVTGSACFMVLRQGSFNTIQVVYFKDKSNPEALDKSQRFLKWLGELTLESVVDIEGGVVSAKVKSCSINHLEISLKSCHVVSRAKILPFQIEDAARSDADITASQNTSRPFPRLGQVTRHPFHIASTFLKTNFFKQELRLNNRYLDLRVPSNNAIMRIQSAVGQLFREFLYQEGFVEIHSPKVDFFSKAFNFIQPHVLL